MKENKINLRDSEGKMEYTRTLCMMLYKAVSEECPAATLRIEHSISRGQLCRLLQSDGTGLPVDSRLVSRLKERMRRLASGSLPIERRVCSRKEAIEMFRCQGLLDKVTLLEQGSEQEVVYYMLDGLADSYVGSLASNTSDADVFDLRSYKDGMLLLGPDPENPSMPVLPVSQSKMYKAFRQSLEFNKVIGVGSVGELNETIRRGNTGFLINVAEAMHNKLLGRIADDIAKRNRRGGARIILLAGPSSSGKTTSCKRLAVQLCTNLIRPKMISLDDYFVDRVNTPLDENGEYDFESLHALDLDLFNSHLNTLLSGGEVNLPTYSFETGTRTGEPRPLRLEENDVLLIEGIHGLNPELVKNVDPDMIYKVYVSALTSLRLDNHNWISTSDNRLLRRMVRDHKYRGTSPSSTLARWASVRRGEEKWIFPFQENADATFNSSLIFELGVMKDYLEPLLLSIAPDDPNFPKARRLAEFLNYFYSIPPDQVPPASLLREFLGGSSFHY